MRSSCSEESTDMKYDPFKSGHDLDLRSNCNVDGLCVELSRSFVHSVIPEHSMQLDAIKTFVYKLSYLS